MRIALACDHRGFRAKELIKAYLQKAGHDVTDFGCENTESCDYPDTGFNGAKSVAQGQSDRGILLCGTGIGMSMVANKVHGIRAALCHDELTAELSRRHNNANILCLPSDLIGEELTRRVVDIWLRTDYEGGRHERRLNKITQFEQNGHCAPQ
ncbi:MAG: ribose 5-phosphate isomerase B [Phycisphaerae bacterium]|nr:ribose 5-phosphate isomerase B [Phycisphaerae bacterium]